MNTTTIEQLLFDTAIQFVKQRYPSGWGGCAVMRLSSGDIITSVAPDIKLEALGLCMEVGAILEAHKRNLSVTHSICVSRDDENSDFKILTPCGICQERLGFWGHDVNVAVTTDDNILKFVKLRELQPYHWSKAFGEDL